MIPQLLCQVLVYLHRCAFQGPKSCLQQFLYHLLRQIQPFQLLIQLFYPGSPVDLFCLPTPDGSIPKRFFPMFFLFGFPGFLLCPFGQNILRYLTQFPLAVLGHFHKERQPVLAGKLAAGAAAPAQGCRPIYKVRGHGVH